MEVTYGNLLKRAEQSARDYTPDLPTENTLEAWEVFADELESIETNECASQAADSWDWVIYYGQAMQLCTNVPSSVLNNAESTYEDCGDITAAFERGGLYGVACSIAYFIVESAVQEALESLIAELQEVAQDHIEQLGG